MTELGYTTSPEQMGTRLETIASRPDFASFVAVHRGQVVGMIGACIEPSYVHDAPYGRIVALSVEEAFRGKGIGARLVRRAEAWLAGAGATRSVVNSGLHRDAAHGFYRRIGYEETGKRFARDLTPEGRE